MYGLKPWRDGVIHCVTSYRASCSCQRPAKLVNSRRRHDGRVPRVSAAESVVQRRPAFSSSPACALNSIVPVLTAKPKFAANSDGKHVYLNQHVKWFQLCSRMSLLVVARAAKGDAGLQMGEECPLEMPTRTLSTQLSACIPLRKHGCSKINRWNAGNKLPTEPSRPERRAGQFTPAHSPSGHSIIFVTTPLK